MIVAVTTTSSAATLPISIKVAGIVMSTVLLEAIGMPLTLIPILAAIWPAIDPIHTLMNNTSDLVGTMLIARQLDKVDMNVYNS